MNTSPRCASALIHVGLLSACGGGSDAPSEATSEAPAPAPGTQACAEPSLPAGVIDAATLRTGLPSAQVNAKSGVRTYAYTDQPADTLPSGPTAAARATSVSTAWRLASCRADPVGTPRT